MRAKRLPWRPRLTSLTQLVKVREQALDQKEAETARGQELLEYDRDIRELMGARELYMADVHDVSGKGTAKTYGRVFFTKESRLIFLRIRIWMRSRAFKMRDHSKPGAEKVPTRNKRAISESSTKTTSARSAGF